MVICMPRIHPSIYCIGSTAHSPTSSLHYHEILPPFFMHMHNTTTDNRARRLLPHELTLHSIELKLWIVASLFSV